MRIFLSQRRAWVFISIFAVLWLATEIRYQQVRHRLASLWQNTVSVTAVDDSTGDPLQVSIGNVPGLTPERYLPLVSVTTASDTVMKLTVVSDAPLDLTVSSVGYQEQSLIVDRSTLGDVTVKLTKK